MTEAFESAAEASPEHVVIVGAGFAGLHCALQLAEDPNLRITLLDKNNYQQFQPLLYQVATAIIAPTEAAFNLRELVMRHANIDLKMTEAISVDLATRTVVGKSGDRYTGDYLVLAAGAQANFFDTEGIEEFGYPLYSLRDAEKLRSRIIEVLEAADVAHTTGSTDVPHFVVVGGGATGVEISGALADIFDRMPQRVYRNFDMGDVTITLINGKNEVLTGFKEKSRNYAQTVLEKRRVNLRLGRKVKKVTSTEVVLDTEEHLPCNLVIWAGGLKAAALAGNLNIPTGHGGRVDVGPDLKVAGYPGVYALGDFANTKDHDDKPLPQLASVAQQAGRHCAKNIIAAAHGKPETDFKYLDKGIMAMVGRDAAVAEVGEGHHSLTGPIAFAAWLGVHAVLLTTLHAKMAAFEEWAWNYFGGVRVQAILDVPSTVGDVEPAAPATKNQG